MTEKDKFGPVNLNDVEPARLTPLPERTGWALMLPEPGLLALVAGCVCLGLMRRRR